MERPCHFPAADKIEANLLPVDYEFFLERHLIIHLSNPNA